MFTSKTACRADAELPLAARRSASATWLARGATTGQSGAVPALHELIAEHGAAAFPQSIERGLDYGEVDAVMIDADIYGWALRAQDGGLSSTDRDRLHSARDALARSLLAFPDDARSYSTRLVALADAALK